MRRSSTERMCGSWRMDPAFAMPFGPMGTGIELALWHSPDPGERVLGGLDGSDTWILAFHRHQLNTARMTLDQSKVYDGRVASKSWLVVPPGRQPMAQVSGDWEVLHLYIPQEFIRRAARDLTSDALQRVANHCTRLSTDSRISRLLHPLLAAAQMSGPDRSLLIETLGLQVTTELLRVYGCSQSAGRTRGEVLTSRQIRKVRELIELQGLSGLSVGSIARELTLSRSHFSRAWKAETGMTAQQAILDRRLDEAHRLLLETSMSVTEIAFHCGFSSSSHLSTAFRRRYGSTPSTVRRNSPAL